MKTILVLGATGAMGLRLVPYLSLQGYAVDAVALDNLTGDIPNVTVYNFNAKDDAVLSEFLEGKRYDAIVDFMLYYTEEFEKRYEVLLDSAEHYIFLSSYRVYADCEIPIKETSPRLLETTKDKGFLKREKLEYALYKARQEDVLRESGYKNWTIIRPTMVYSTYRYQLVGLEAGVFMHRVRNKKTIVLPESAMDKHAALTWSGDAARLIAGLVLNEKAYGETFTMGSSESHTWREVAECYKRIFGLEYVLEGDEEYEKIIVCDGDNQNVSEWYKHLYDRFFDRIIDNSKILRATGLKQSDFIGFEEGLEKEYNALPREHIWHSSPISESMDRYLINRGSC